MSVRNTLAGYLLGRPGPPLNARAQRLFDEHRQAILGLTDRLFALLLVAEFAVGVWLAIGIARLGGESAAHSGHVLALALGLGGGLMLVSVGLALVRPGRPVTRYLIATTQLGYAALFIELTNGRVDSHFHIFGSLALLAFYRDWKVFLPATAAIVVDQAVRPWLWPAATLEVGQDPLGSGLALVVWVLVLDGFLISGCPRAIREMQETARQRARLEEANEEIAREVELQTAAISASEAQYRMLFECHPLPMWVYDEETLAIVNVNDAAMTGYGHTRTELASMVITDITEATTLPSHTAAAQGPDAGDVSVYRRKDGTQVHVETIEHAFVLRGRRVRLLAAQDVSRRRRAERLIAAQQSVARELAVAGSVHDAARPILNLVTRSMEWDFGVFWLVDPSGDCLEVREVVSTDPGLSELESAVRQARRARGEGLVGATWSAGHPIAISDITDPRLSRDFAAIAERHDLKTLLSIPILGANRVLGVLQFVSRDRRMNDLPMVRAIEAVARNIGQFIERKRLEERLHLLADIVEASSDAIYAVDLDGRILSWNAGARKLFGYSEHELLGQPIARLVPEDHISEMLGLVKRVASGERLVNCEVPRMRKDGSVVQVQLSASPLRDATGHVIGLSVVARDVTEDKRLRARLQQAQKLEAIGELAAGIAHEINTPTQYVGDNVQFLSRAFHELNGCLSGWEELLGGPDAVGLDPTLRRKLDAVTAQADLEFIRAEVDPAIAAAQDGVSRISQIVGAMKEFSHPGTREKAPTDLNRAIQSTLMVARGEWKHHAEIVTEFDPELPLVHCRPDEINQVFLNLIVNAAHAIRDARPGSGRGPGTIRVTTRAAGPGVEVRISDTGAGIPENIRARIYDPFFTTKGVGKGTGQGLAIAHDVVVVKHGGTIEFDSTVGVGTTFVVTLPLGDDGTQMEAAA